LLGFSRPESRPSARGSTRQRGGRCDRDAVSAATQHPGTALVVSTRRSPVATTSAHAATRSGRHAVRRSCHKPRRSRHYGVQVSLGCAGQRCAFPPARWAFRGSAVSPCSDGRSTVQLRGRVLQDAWVSAKEVPGDASGRGADYFDHWYADMQTHTTKDSLLARRFELPADLGSAGALHWDAVLEITRELRVPAGGLLVDLACGRGGYGIEVARRSEARLIGVDFSAVALKRARAIADRRLLPEQAEFCLEA